jgi:aryl-alcohol dehydrogenase-like predicted oxidoreductase
MFRRAIEATVLPYCRNHDIGVIAYGPLGHGLLTGVMRESTVFAPDDWRRKSPDFRGEPFRRNLAVVDDLQHFAADRNVSLAVLALAWTLANPAVDAAIVGTSNAAHLTDAVDAADVRLSHEDLVDIDRILAPSAPVRGPSPEGMPPG